MQTITGLACQKGWRGKSWSSISI